MDQVLLTFGFTFIFYDLVQTVWGKVVLTLPTPASLQSAVHIGCRRVLRLPALPHRLRICRWRYCCGCLLERSRIGAMVRAGVDNAAMAAGLGANIPALFTGVFGFGVALAALGGIAAGPGARPLSRHGRRHPDPGIHRHRDRRHGKPARRVRGSLLIGIADTFGKAYFPSIAQFLIYLAMTLVLLIRPQGLFGVKYSDISPPSAVTRIPASAATRAPHSSPRSSRSART